MGTIIYQGRTIRATKLAAIDDCITNRQSCERVITDELWRGANGRYYARQERFNKGNRHSNYRESVHRLSLHGAIQWAIRLTGSDGLPLRADVKDMIGTLGLDSVSEDLVRRYLDVTPYNYTVADIIGGCVRFALDQAFHELPAVEEDGKLDDYDFHDSAWGYVEREIHKSKQCRECSVEKSRLPEEARNALDRPDVALCAAATPNGDGDEEDEKSEA